MRSSKPDMTGETNLTAPIGSLCDALPYATAICARDGKILHANQALANMLELNIGDIEHRQASFLNPDIVQGLDALFSSGEFWSGDIMVINESQNTIPCHMTVSTLPLNHAGESHIAALLTLVENPGPHQVRQDTFAQQQRHDANATKNDFLANMGHELRTPLNAIIGNAELIEHGVLGDIDVAYRECGQDIHQAGLHLLSLVNDVLDSAKLADGAMKLHPTPTNIISVAHEAVRLILDDYRRRAHTLTIDLPDHDVILDCDRMKLKQILINILSNAGKFTPDGGRISLSLALTQDEAIFTITDNGVGMSAQDIPRALTRFSQLHPEGIKESAGTGLGLPLAKMLTELHGGRFIIESNPGKGTTIKICLPKRQAASNLTDTQYL
ncbi:PAS domain-containing sensor histidine kinase [Thalassospira sp. TSL5-1]|uniref:PAS domain-containing sensor histidine kinase n=1 Tax=Thalassospira sp. TSL5-1 TaxID=1544451 RepID=UPI000A4D2F53|nr:PAS domain-containing sensor histidine kinase [Thalassospira sp. TSL5-1]